MLRALLGGLAVALLTAPLLAGDDPKPAPVDEKAMMEAYAKAATPGPAHKRLDVLVGSWTYTRQVTRVTGPDGYEEEFYKVLPDGKEAKMMALKFTRAKGQK